MDFIKLGLGLGPHSGGSIRGAKMEIIITRHSDESSTSSLTYGTCLSVLHIINPDSQSLVRGVAPGCMFKTSL
jgi:hypothetical protein